MKMISAVVQVGVSVGTQLQTAQRRFDAESSKSPQDQATQRLEELQAAIKEVSHSASHLPHTLDLFLPLFLCPLPSCFLSCHSVSFPYSLAQSRFLYSAAHPDFRVPLGTVTRGAD